MRKLTVTLVCCALIAPILIGAAVQWGTLDGLFGNTFALIDGEDTVYAPGYSDRAFRQIDIGMTEPEVLKLLGEPISRWRLTGVPLEDWSRSIHVDSVCWQYSYSPGDTHFRMRYVYIKDGNVIAKRAGFWVD